ncbi:MAG: Crp/Fnr family transcriptional regulator [Limnochordia bacterium]|jgi:CRP-like cAMP-binding protein|nr:Crp/Fnr family transcriptional regulator [Bacillota bacterium]HOB08569.1 Crp/Fnr family transcriptional regulator [Limnochordia bacterium]NLH31471.1 Crp/Fnr family transcriptional regulator [Bacillota bacterium]HPT92717.1 Crp/Fnr family transcriptional regulator [Limnochordia bacterium]HPZ30710.1 Crp/Fnr family transcriptional regulator [Limnochordia bacterium]
MHSCGHKGGHADCIRTVPIFSHITHEEMLEIARIIEARTYRKGEMVYLAGDPGGKLYVLHTGKVKITRINPSGKEQVIRILGPGEFMGELSLFRSSPQTDNAEALEESTMCVMDGAKLKELMLKNPSISLKVMEELSQRLQKAENLIEVISLDSVEQRLAQALLALAGDKAEITLKMAKKDFASQMGMSRETLSRKLAAFQEQGLIRLEGQRRIVILDKEGLQAVRLGP